MSEYTYKDVIIDPEDPRVEIGKEYYFGDPAEVVLAYAKGGASARILEAARKGSNYPFTNDIGDYPCIIRKKEPEKKYVPFDLNNEEDRAKLRGAWVRIKDIPTIEYQIIGMNAKYVLLGNAANLETDDLLRSYEFIDGSPCGKEAEG